MYNSCLKIVITLVFFTPVNCPLCMTHIVHCRSDFNRIYVIVDLARNSVNTAVQVFRAWLNRVNEVWVRHVDLHRCCLTLMRAPQPHSSFCPLPTTPPLWGQIRVGRSPTENIKGHR